MKTAGITSQTHGVKAEKGRESKRRSKPKESSPCTDNHYHSKYLCKERKKCTGAAVLPVRRDRGKVERSGGKTVMLAMPPACPRRSQSRRGLRCLVPASRSSDQPSISPLSIHPQADYSVITHTHSDSPSQLTHPLVHSLPPSHWKAVTIHMSEADAWLYIQLRWYSFPLPSSLLCQRDGPQHRAVSWLQLI